MPCRNKEVSPATCFTEIYSCTEFEPNTEDCSLCIPDLDPPCAAAESSGPKIPLLMLKPRIRNRLEVSFSSSESLRHDQFVRSISLFKDSKDEDIPSLQLPNKEALSALPLRRPVPQRNNYQNVKHSSFATSCITTTPPTKIPLNLDA